MNFLEQIKGLNDEELKEVVSWKIKQLEEGKPENEPKEIGFIVESNPKNFDTYEIDGMKCFDLGMNCFHPGYIKKGTKIIYGLSYNDNGTAKNEGAYYYMDEEEYIYEFWKFIRDKDVINEYELLEYILEF